MLSGKHKYLNGCYYVDYLLLETEKKYASGQTGHAIAYAAVLLPYLDIAEVTLTDKGGTVTVFANRTAFLKAYPKRSDFTKAFSNLHLWSITCEDGTIVHGNNNMLLLTRSPHNRDLDVFAGLVESIACKDADVGVDWVLEKGRTERRDCHVASCISIL